MYKRFYGLAKNAFSLTPDPRFLVLTQAHCEVKAALTYAIITRKGFSVLTGDAGTGKTTLLRAVIESIPEQQLCFSFLVNPVLTPEEFYELVLGDFGLPNGATKPERLKGLLDFLVHSHAAGQFPVLFVDEAHRLSVEILEEIRLLTNFETATEKLLHIVLVGQDELNDLLDRRDLRQLKQRVEVRQHIGPLHSDEVPEYIRYRWRCAGGSEPPFSEEAVRQIGRISGGIPRLINSICDNALLLGFAESSPVVTERHISEVSEDLRLNGAGPGRPAQMPEERSGKIEPAASGTRVGTLGLRDSLPAVRAQSTKNQMAAVFEPPKLKRSRWLRLWRAEQA